MRRFKVVAVVVVALSPVSMANALPGDFPGSSPSRYKTAIDEISFRQDGCALGRAIAEGETPKNALSILSLGRPTKMNDGPYAVVPHGGTMETDKVPLSEVRSAALAYAAGFRDCLGLAPGRVTLVLGAKNERGASLPALEMEAHGAAFREMVVATNRQAASQLLTPLVTIAGGIDVEPDFGPPGEAIAWTEGYKGMPGALLYNFGAASGCPPYGPCNYGWTQADLWETAAGPGVFAVPQIYNEAGRNAEQWRDLCLWGIEYRGNPITGRINFAGSLTQHRACNDPGRTCSGTANTPEQGWEQLRDTLHGTDCDQPLLYATDIGWS